MNWTIWGATLIKWLMHCRHHKKRFVSKKNAGAALWPMLLMKCGRL